MIVVVGSYIDVKQAWASDGQTIPFIIFGLSSNFNMRHYYPLTLTLGQNQPDQYIWWIISFAPAIVALLLGLANAIYVYCSNAKLRQGWVDAQCICCSHAMLPYRRFFSNIRIMHKATFVIERMGPDSTCLTEPSFHAAPDTVPSDTILEAETKREDNESKQHLIKERVQSEVVPCNVDKLSQLLSLRVSSCLSITAREIGS